MKIKKKFVCSQCGYVTVNWIGKCPECLNWNTLVEEIYNLPKKTGRNENEKKLINSNEIELSDNYFLKTNNQKVNSFFGEGVTAGSVILITGEPGVGKSTFLLFFSNILDKNVKKYYFSGEESHSQIKKRCDRLKLIDINLFISNEVNIEKIIELCKNDKPDIIFIDSIQTCNSSEIDTSVGTITQIKYCTSLLIEFAKSYSIPIIITGHMTKTGDIAGPKIMEHMVDVVVIFESEFNYYYRVIRSIKNRYSSIDELLIFEMKEDGLFLVNDISQYFIDKHENEAVIGKCKTVIVEGRHPIVCEIEALVVPTVYSNPRRFSEGADVSRIARIAAILDKHINEKFNNFDIYFNISGGIKTKDVGIDLAIAAAIYSSKNKLKIKNDIVVLGELSLTGKIRNILRIEQRINEAKKFGIDSIFIPSNNYNKNDKSIQEIIDISSAIKFIFM